VLLLRKMGLIPFVRTTTPQSNKTFCTNNNITGYAKNPWDETRSCGGSSGGEGGMVGSHCSPIGIGSDIGGSSRIPCAFNGIITLKPYYRYSNKSNAYTGRYAGGLPIRAETTPMCRTVEDCIIWNQFIFDKDNYTDIPRRLKDPYLKLTPFNNVVFKEQKKYKFGYFVDIVDHVKSSPADRRAVQ
jgi:fatty acid amide hydrolase